MSDSTNRGANNAPNAQIPIRENAKRILDLKGHDVSFSEGKTLRGESALVMIFRSEQSHEAYLNALFEKGIMLGVVREPIGNGAYCVKLNTQQCVDVIQLNQQRQEEMERKAEEAANVIAASTDSMMGNVVDLKKGKSFKGIKKIVRLELDSPGSKLRKFAMPMIVHSYNLEKPPEPSAELGIDKVNVKVNLGKKEVFLNTYQYEPEALKAIPPAEKKYVVHFNGNAQFAADKITESVDEAKKINCVAIAFDYHGVGGKDEDKAKNTKELVKAGVAQVKDLIKAGAKPENIVLDGHSLGGAVATLVAAQLHKEGLKVHLINGRSFSKLSTESDLLLNKNAGVLAGQMAGKENPDGSVKENKKIKALGLLLGKLAKAGIKAAGLEMNAAKAYKSIPEEYKTCYFAQKDEIIPFKASLAKAVGIKKDNDLIGFSSGTDAGDHNTPARNMFNGEFRSINEVRIDFIKKAFKIEEKKLAKDNSDDFELMLKPTVKGAKKTAARDPVDTPHAFLPLNHQLIEAAHTKKKVDPEPTNPPSRPRSTKLGD